MMPLCPPTAYCYFVTRVTKSRVSNRQAAAEIQVNSYPGRLTSQNWNLLAPTSFLAIYCHLLARQVLCVRGQKESCGNFHSCFSYTVPRASVKTTHMVVLRLMWISYASLYECMMCVCVCVSVFHVCLCTCVCRCTCQPVSAASRGWGYISSLMVLHFTYEAGSFTVPEFANSAHRTLQLALGILSSSSELWDYRWAATSDNEITCACHHIWL